MPKTKTKTKQPDFNPEILVFCCNWCSYAGADLAGVSRFQYPPNMRIVRVMCSGRVDPAFIVKALKDGADGVLITDAILVIVIIFLEMNTQEKDLGGCTILL